jgi:hypothetical protein
MDATEELPAGAAGGDLVLGRYRLGRRLGSGGFGTVYEARDERLGRAVAVKAIPTGGPAPERGEREALAAARLHHPAIVQVYDAGEDAAGRYLVSELVRGRTLAALEADGALSDRDVLRLGLALADGLAHAHERGVIHRDVKPQNVIVPVEPGDPRGAAKLTDFGVAHMAGDEPLTRTGDVVGTLAYMAPEQAAGERVDERADLYSLALVVYEALAGTNPVRAASPAATARRLGTVLPPLSRHRGDLPAELCEALDRALAPDPDARATLDDLADALADALPEVSDAGGTIAPHPLEQRARPRIPARLLAGLAAGGLVALAVAAAGDPGAFGADPAVVGGGEGAGGGAETSAAIVAGGAAALAVALLPRAGWLASAAACVALLAGPWPAAAALAGAAAAIPPLLLQRSGLGWSLPAAAPALGLIGVAGAYPALAGLARAAWTRAALGATGLWWLLLVEGDGSARRVIEQAVTSGALLLAPVWAAAALVLPWLVRPPLRAALAGAAAWAAGLAAATAAVAEQAGLPEPRNLFVGAVAAGTLAVAGRATRGSVKAGEPRP